MAYTSLHDLALPTCSIYLLLSNTLPKSSVAWNNIYCLAVSVGQEPKCSSAGSSASGLFQAAFKVMERTASHLNAQLERILFQAHSHVCWQDSGYHGLLVWRPQSLLITGQTPPPAPYHLGLSLGQLKTLLFVSPEGVSQKNRQRKGERVCMSEGGHGFLQPGLRSNIPSLCHMLFVGNESLSPNHTQGEGVAQGCEHEDMDVLGSHIRRCTPSCSNLISQASRLCSPDAWAFILSFEYTKLHFTHGLALPVPLPGNLFPRSTCD